jgi:hypothetical protein
MGLPPPTPQLLYRISNVVCRMTLVQAQIPESEYRLLRQRAAATGKPMKEVVRLALHAYLQDETVNPNDPIFHIFPLGASGKKGHRTARDHDIELYGPTR